MLTMSSRYQFISTEVQPRSVVTSPLKPVNLLCTYLLPLVSITVTFFFMAAASLLFTVYSSSKTVQSVSRFGYPKYSHIIPVLNDLHQLPVKARIEFKILLMMFQCVHGPVKKVLDILKIFLTGEPHHALGSDPSIGYCLRYRAWSPVPRGVRFNGGSCFLHLLAELQNILSLQLFETKLRAFFILKCLFISDLLFLLLIFYQYIFNIYIFIYLYMRYVLYLRIT